MAALKKIILTPFFGAFPEWMDKFQPPEGYNWLLDTDLVDFKNRVKMKLGFDFHCEWGGTKIWDYRSALGYLYEEEIKGYDYWATMDFDVVFGDVNKFFPDEEIEKWDVWSNHDSYVCGFWSIYRNCKEVNELFLSGLEFLKHKEINGWVEGLYSRLLENSGLEYKYSGDLQGDPYHPPFNLKKEDGKLYQDGIEIPMLHFRRRKIYPL
jgi:hypothetical protein